MYSLSFCAALHYFKIHTSNIRTMTFSTKNDGRIKGNQWTRQRMSLVKHMIFHRRGDMEKSGWHKFNGILRINRRSRNLLLATTNVSLRTDISYMQRTEICNTFYPFSLILDWKPSKCIVKATFHLGNSISQKGKYSYTCRRKFLYIACLTHFQISLALY